LAAESIHCKLSLFLRVKNPTPTGISIKITDAAIGTRLITDGTIPGALPAINLPATNTPIKKPGRPQRKTAAAVAIRPMLR